MSISNRVYNQKEYDSVIGVGTETRARHEQTTSLDQRKKLRTAQNANRGRPKADAARVELRQMNVSCPSTLCQAFEDLSLKEGKTKRTLMEEALALLFKQYKTKN